MFLTFLLDNRRQLRIVPLTNVGEQVVHGLVVERAAQERGPEVTVGKVEGRFDLQLGPIGGDVAVLVGLGPSDFVVDVGGLEDECEVEGPGQVGDGVQGDEAEDGDLVVEQGENEVMKRVD